jgi:hypothetical protein
MVAKDRCKKTPAGFVPKKLCNQGHERTGVVARRSGKRAGQKETLCLECAKQRDAVRENGWSRQRKSKGANTHG